MTQSIHRIALTMMAAGLVSTAAAAVELDAKIPAYQQVDGVAGSIKSVGSDTMNNMMTMWAEGFQKMYPNVRVSIEGKGSGTAVPALVDGTSTFGPMSRKAKDKERDAFEAAFGYKPTQLGTSIDMLAVYVHKDNPIKALSLPQLDAIFSKTRKGGYPEDITTWGQLGLTGEWAKLPISAYGRNSSSGTYGYFKKHALFKGDYKDTIKEQSGSAAVVNGCANDKGGIGYSGIGYKTADVKTPDLSEETDGDAFSPAAENAADYPLARFLYLSVNYKPGQPLDKLRAEFIKYIFSKQGQLDVIKDGYIPLTSSQCKKALAAVGL